MDKIAEMLTQIRNAQMAGHKEVSVGFSKFKFSLAKTLEKEGFVKKVFQDEKKFVKIRIVLKYENVPGSQKMPAIRGIKKISCPGQRIYVRYKNIKKVRNGFGISIISTSKGLMTGEESRKNKLGGEYLCDVW